MDGGMGTSAVGAMSASSDTRMAMAMAMAMGVVVETIVAMVVADGPLA
jgi:hypothetical protein